MTLAVHARARENLLLVIVLVLVLDSNLYSCQAGSTVPYDLTSDVEYNGCCRKQNMNFFNTFLNNQWTEFDMTEACRLTPSRATAVLYSKFVEFNSVNWDQHGSSTTFELPGPVEGFFFAQNERKAKVVTSKEKEEVKLWFKLV